MLGVRGLCGLGNNALELCLVVNNLRGGADAQRGGRREKRISWPIPRLDGKCSINWPTSLHSHKVLGPVLRWETCQGVFFVLK